MPGSLLAAQQSTELTNMRINEPFAEFSFLQTIVTTTLLMGLSIALLTLFSQAQGLGATFTLILMRGGLTPVKVSLLPSVQLASPSAWQCWLIYESRQSITTLRISITLRSMRQE